MAIGYEKHPQGIMDRAFRRFSAWGSRRAQFADTLLQKEAQEGFRNAQQLAYNCVTTVGAQLYQGMSEKQAAKMLEDYLRTAGSERFIHRPFAWFGEHSRFDGYRGYGDFHPGERRLEPQDTVILDVSPVVKGYTADVGYTLSLERNTTLENGMLFLRALRDRLPEMFESDLTPRNIWIAVDRLIAEAGYDNIHARYPFSVLGHRVFKVSDKGRKARRFPFGALGWFSLEANLAFLKTGFGAALTPDNEGSRAGLWAIEPHIGWPGGGAKFEEILVVDGNGARWLSNDVPHMADEGLAQSGLNS